MYSFSQYFYCWLSQYKTKFKIPHPLLPFWNIIVFIPFTKTCCEILQTKLRPQYQEGCAPFCDAATHRILSLRAGYKEASQRIILRGSIWSCFGPIAASVVILCRNSPWGWVYLLLFKPVIYCYKNYMSDNILFWIHTVIISCNNKICNKNNSTRLANMFFYNNCCRLHKNIRSWDPTTQGSVQRYYWISF